ncbi:MAG: hypothetical protein V7K35_08175 [Nostoc sp.]|uniref:hypothetical protein n=1 Tax=Nostoc sp. TaxID=1180 RepID=UPI002FFCC80D
MNVFIIHAQCRSKKTMIYQKLNSDNTSVFEQLWTITNQLRQKLENHFQLNPAHFTNDLNSYSSIDGNFQGSLKAFSGKEIAWKSLTTQIK